MTAPPRPTIQFYARHLPTCQICSKPAAAEIRGTGNVSYGVVCKGCVNKKIRALEKAHNSSPENQ